MMRYRRSYRRPHKSRFVEMFGDLNGSLFPQSTIGEVCEVKSGGTPDRKVREYWENGDIPWVNAHVR